MFAAHLEHGCGGGVVRDQLPVDVASGEVNTSDQDLTLQIDALTKHACGKNHIRPDYDVAPFADGMKVFHVARFVSTVLPRGMEKWLQSYNREREKFADFVERYDTVVSEARLVFPSSS